MEFLTILPNLSTAVVAILALVYLSKKFLDRLEAKDEQLIAEMSERESAFRELEKEVRTNIMDQLSKNTQAFKKVIEHIEYKK